MDSQDLLVLFLESKKDELSTQELYELAIKKYAVDSKYDDYEHHIRGLQQVLANQGLIKNVRRGYWVLV